MSTDIELAIGDVVAVMAWGVWDMGAGAVDPDGEEELCDCVVREPVSTGSQGKLGALIGRIGEQGEPFLIGSQQLMVAVDNGTLFLGSNDNSGRSSTGEFTFVVEYKAKENTQRSVVAASDHQSFPETRLTYTKTIPIVYRGQVDEIIINFIEKGEASKVVIESIQLINQVDTQ